MLFKLEGLYKRTQASIGFLSKAYGRDGEYDDFSETRQPMVFDQTVGEKLLAEWRGMKWLSHLEFRLVADSVLEEQVDALEATLEDEEAGHLETLEMLRIVKSERDELLKQNDALRGELEMRAQTIRELRTHLDRREEAFKQLDDAYTQLRRSV